MVAAAALADPRTAAYLGGSRELLNPTTAMAHETAAPPQNTLALGAGFGIGLLWWLMAVTCLWSAFRGFANDRYDWGLTWGLIGTLLLAAGTAAMVGTWWHLTRVRDH